MTIYNDTLSAGLTASTAYVPTTLFQLTATENAQVLDPFGATGYGTTMTPGIRVELLTTAIKRYNEVDAIGVGMHDVSTPLIRPGAIVNEVVSLQTALAPNIKYAWTAVEQIYLAQALGLAIPRTITENVAVHFATTAAMGVTTLQGLGLASTPLPSLKYTQTLLQGIGVSDLFRNFFGGAVIEGIGVHEVLAKQFKANPILTDGIGIAPALTQKLYIRVTTTETIELTDTEILKMLYSGVIADGLDIVAGYVSPDGQFTTWAMNTRSAAVTEFTNYAFNSFARIGTSYYGASSSGLYKLNGDTDDGTSIIADIKSGFAEWGGSNFAIIKGIYLGLRGEGNWVLKLTTGDGKEFDYAISTRDQRTTKVHVGKGLKARYWAFELISAGQDFDLDTIEFVPLVAGRRV